MNIKNTWSAYRASQKAKVFSEDTTVVFSLKKIQTNQTNHTYEGVYVVTQGDSNLSTEKLLVALSRRKNMFTNDTSGEYRKTFKSIIPKGHYIKSDDEYSIVYVDVNNIVYEGPF